jgi:hypothetical protein
MDMGWMFGVIWKFVVEYEKSVAQYPNIKPGEEFQGYGEATHDAAKERELAHA